MASRKDSKGYALRTGESQRDDGRYQFRYTYAGQRQTVYGKTLAELRKKEKELEKQLLLGINVNASNSTIAEFFELYMSSKVALKPSTKRNYIEYFDHYIKETIGDMKIVDVRFSTLKKFYSSLYLENDLKVSSMSCIHSVLSPMFEMAVYDNAINKNIEREAWKSFKKEISETPEPVKALPREVQDRFLTFLRNTPRCENTLRYVEFILGTGLRTGEVIALKWNVCDFKRNEIRVEENSYYVSDQGITNGTPKTKAGKRSVPMLEPIREMLLELRKEAFASGKAGNDNYVFLGRKGGQLGCRRLYQSIKSAGEKYNKFEIEISSKEHREPDLIEKISPHVLRHTFCTRLCEEDVNLKVIQSVMGHSDIRVTMNIYADVSSRKNQEVFAALGKVNII